MINLLSRVFGVVAFLVFCGLGDAAPRRVALVVGIQDYGSLNALNNPVGDAEAIAATLEQYGFVVTLGKNLDHAAFEKLVEDFARSSQGAEEAILFYSGHGLAVLQEGRSLNALAASDANINCKSGQAQKVIAPEDILAKLNHVPKTIALFDACRNDPFPPQCGVASALSPGFQQPQMKGVGLKSPPPSGSSSTKGIGVSAAGGNSDVLIAYSSDLGRAALDGEPGKHSPFADALLIELKDGPNTPFRDLLERTTSRVKNSTGFQNPWVVSVGGVPQMCPASSGCEFRTDVQKQGLVATSRFRTEKATLLLRQNDKTAAMLLALESMPDATSTSKERREWPLIPEARTLLDKTLREGQEQRTIYLKNSGTTDRVLITGFDRKGEKLFSWSDDGGSEVWNVATGEAAKATPGEPLTRPDNQYLVMVQPDGSTLHARDAAGALGVVQVGDRVQLRELLGGRSRGALRGFPAGPIRVGFFPNGDRVFAVGEDGSVVIWDAKSTKALGRVKLRDEGAYPVRDVKLDPSGTLFLDIDQGGFAGITPLDNAQAGYSLEPHNAFFSDFSSDGKLVALASEHAVVISDLDTQKAVQKFVIQPASVYSVRFSPDDATLAVGTDFGQIHVFKVRKNSTATASPVDCRRPVLIPDSLIRNKVPNPSIADSVRTPEELTLTISMLRNRTPIFKQYYGRNGEGGTYKYIVVDSAQRIAATKGIDYNPKSNAQTSEDIIIWNLNNNNILGRIRDGFSGLNHHFDVSADGKFLVSFGDDAFAQLWDLQTFQKTFALSEHAHTVEGACFSPSGKEVATIDHNSANLWDVTTGKKLQSWPTDFEPSFMGFSEDGGSLIVADRSAAEEGAKAQRFVITASPQAMVEEAKKSAPRCLTLSERQKFGLPASPPEWCVKMGKPPYNSEVWRAWLHDRELGKQVSLPNVE
jgi:WD40 repeat protein